VRRSANRLADWLENEGVLCKNDYSFYKWELTPAGNLREECHSLAQADNEIYLKTRERQLSGNEEDGEIGFI